MSGQQHTTQVEMDLVSHGLDRVPDVAKFLGISRSQVYAFMGRGELPYVKIHKSRRVPRLAVLEFAARNLITGD